MGEVVRLSKRLSYLEDQLKNIQPASPAVSDSLDLSQLTPILEKLKKEVELLKVNNSSSELESLKQEIKSLKESNQVLHMKVEQLEQSVVGMLDRVLTLKEKIEPSMEMNLLEARVMSLEERYAAREVVGIGSS